MALLFVIALAFACSTGPTWSWPDADFADQGGAPFDPDTIIDQTASLTDDQSVPQSVVQSFLMQTPYGTQSFLATYASNGVSAAEAMQNAATTYQLNPLVFLVRAEIDQALISQVSYPAPASRVEFAFGCGCDVTPSPTNPSPKCDPSLAGFDKQVDCLARTMRSYLDSVCGTPQATAGGWAMGTTKTTIDGVAVTPSNEGTAALYQYAPLVLVNEQGGNWLFWNVYQMFANAVSYPGAYVEGFVGDSCCGNDDCSAYPSGVCVVNYPSGMCSQPCDAQNVCPSDTGRVSVCVDTGPPTGPYCFFDCTNDPCRPGYVCETVDILGGGTTSACKPGS
ncbi:MAG TPA: hypothetical protein VH054_04170 [Polyangiaceae bacterium]|nr:hypothetical protein [Polyangiaceae bacterium]